MKFRLSKGKSLIALLVFFALGSESIHAEELSSSNTEPTSAFVTPAPSSTDETPTSAQEKAMLDKAESATVQSAVSSTATDDATNEAATQPANNAVADDQTTAATAEVTDLTTKQEAVVAPTAVASPVASQQPTEGETVNVRILSTTDLHTNLVNYDYYQDKPSQTIGLAKTAVLIEAEKAKNENIILVDNGDTIQGTPLGTYKAIVNPVKPGENHPMYAALEALGFDAGTLGNHEFNYGLDYLKTVMDGTNLPLVNANVKDATTGSNLFTPFIIKEKTFKSATNQDVTLKVGITGIVPPQILTWDKANLEGKVTVQDSVEAIQAVVPQMRQAGADIVLVLSHSGIGNDKYEKGKENVGYHIAGVSGVDAVVTGHSHAEFPTNTGKGYEALPHVDGAKGTIHGTPVVMAGKYGDHLGIIDLTVAYQGGKWVVTDGTGQIRKIDTKSDVANQQVVDIAKEAHEATIEYVRQQVGTTTDAITSYFALVKDDPSVQIVNNAQLWYAAKELAGTPEATLPLLSAAAPFKAGTRGDATAYTDIPAGPIAIKNVADLYLYDNVTAVLKVTGAQLREWLEMSAGQFNQVDPNEKGPQDIINPNFRTYNFDVIDGVTYEIDITQPNKYSTGGELVNPTARRILNLTYQGQPVHDEQEFMVVTNNYRAYGPFPGVRDAAVKTLLNLENRQAIINYIVNEGTINPTADNNWRFASTAVGLDLRFATADKAKILAENIAEIAYIDGVDGGFGNYRFIVTLPSDNTVNTPQTEEQPLLSKLKQLAAAAIPTAAPVQNTRSTVAAATLPNTGSQEESILKYSSVLAVMLVIFGLALNAQSKRKQA